MIPKGVHQRNAAPVVRRFSRLTLVLFGVYGAFAVVLDGFHVLSGQLGIADRSGRTYLLLLEDGGELIVVTMLVGHILWHLHKRIAEPTRLQTERT